MSDLMPLWQTLLGGALTLTATVVTQYTIGRRDRQARAAARAHELADLAGERAHARQMEVRSRSREAAERALGVSIGLRDAWNAARDEEEPFTSTGIAGLRELTTVALLIEDPTIRETLDTANSAITSWAIVSMVEQWAPERARKAQRAVLREVVELLGAHLRGDDEELKQRLENVARARQEITDVQREAWKDRSTGDPVPDADAESH